jgi:hypothetical protein
LQRDPTDSEIISDNNDGYFFKQELPRDDIDSGIVSDNND